MTVDDVARQLAELAGARDVVGASYDLVDRWDAAAVGLEAVAPVLRFMQEHPHVELGNPGPLVHFVERFHRAGYVELLVESVRRKPTALTAWMLNRVIDGTEDPVRRAELVALMREAREHPLADEETVASADLFLANDR